MRAGTTDFSDQAMDKDRRQADSCTKAKNRWIPFLLGGLLAAGALGSGGALCASGQQNESSRIATERGSATILVEPYAPNIVRVSISLLKDQALAAPGYGITAQPAARAHESGAPFMRGLFLDFGHDPNAANIGDEYMFGPGCELYAVQR